MKLFFIAQRRVIKADKLPLSGILSISSWVVFLQVLLQMVFRVSNFAIQQLQVLLVFAVICKKPLVANAFTFNNSSGY
jgi:hypothetical protein